MRLRLAAAIAAALTVAAGGRRSLSAVPSPISLATPATPVLVELFTSEGCSSCPPADALLADFIGASPVPDVDVIGLSEHVDYWDELGWRDPFSQHVFTERQTRYAEALPGTSANGVYTPEMVVDGAAGFVGSDRRAARSAIAAAAATAKIPVTLTWPDGSGASLAIAIEGRPRDAGAHVSLAIAQERIEVAVKRGENAGRTLAHRGVTRRLTEIGRLDRDGTFSRTIGVPREPSWGAGPFRAVVFVADARGRVIGAAQTPAR